MADAPSANIGPRGRRRRLLLGIAWLAVAVAFAELAREASLAVRALVFLPLFGGAVGWFQAREKT